METVNWGKDKPIVLGGIAQQIASSAEAMFQFHTYVKNETGPLADLLKLPPLGIWLDFYTNHRIIKKFTRDLFNFSPFGQVFLDLVEIFTEFKKIPPEKVNKFWRRIPANTREKIVSNAQGELKAILELHRLDLAEDLGEVEIDSAQQAAMEEVLRRPEAAFYFRVWTPCVLNYGLTPLRMLRIATRGDLDALEKMLRLDNSLLHHPLVGRQMHSLRAQGRVRQYRRILEAIQKPPAVKTKRKQIKGNLAGLISAIAKLQGREITEKQIRDLFDAVAKDSKRGPIDTDLPESPEAFGKRIQRERPTWLATITPDKK